MENKPNLTFDEATHSYHADGVKLTSVSALLGVLTKQSLKNTTNERIKEKARVNSEAAIEKGKEFHRQAAEYAKRRFTFTKNPTPPENTLVKSAVDKIHDYLTVQRKIEKGFEKEIFFKGLAIEEPICDVENNLAGTPDLIYFGESDTVIIDYKTNAQFDPNSFGKFMEPPLDTLPDTSMAAYQMQMNLYAHLVSVWYGVPIESISAHIVHINDAHGAVIYENCITPKSRALTVKLLEWKKRNEIFIKNSINETKND